VPPADFTGTSRKQSKRQSEIFHAMDEAFNGEVIEQPEKAHDLSEEPLNASEAL
jgi:hypothetical protein